MGRRQGPREASFPDVEGAVGPRQIDAWRIAWWQLRAPFLMGFARRHGIPEDRRIVYLEVGIVAVAAILVGWQVTAHTGNWGSGLAGAAAAAIALPTIVYLVAGILNARASGRTYMTEARDAAVHVMAKNGTWRVENYVVQDIGSKAGETLRTQLVPTLLRAMDDQDAALYLVAASPLHARLYRAHIDSLIDIGAQLPRGRRMYRPRRTDRERLANTWHSAAAPRSNQQQPAD